MNSGNIALLRSLFSVNACCISFALPLELPSYSSQFAWMISPFWNVSCSRFEVNAMELIFFCLCVSFSLELFKSSLDICFSGISHFIVDPSHLFLLSYFSCRNVNASSNSNLEKATQLIVIMKFYPYSMAL